MKLYTLTAVKSAIIASVYAATTIVLGYLSYGGLQFRISDAMLILPLFEGMGLEAVVGLAIGGLLGNLASPFVPWDWVFGPAANLLASIIVYLIRMSKLRPLLKLTASSVLAALAVALLVGFELTVIYGLPALVYMYLFVSELVVIAGIGGLVYRSLKVFTSE
ncbi:MAG: QueT transporter family protein [Desulfurococcus sp.]|nr:QueT transporter family protein [Desulfurococcus sp.]